MKLYEKNGDVKVTVLGESTRVLKSDVRIHLLGELDELNSHIGLVRSLTQDTGLWQELLEIQKVLLTIKRGVEQPAGSRMVSVRAEQVTELETKIGQLERQLTQAEGEILPGGCFYSAQIDIARNIVRRCERRFTEVAASHPMDETAGAYLNRLSDYLYIQARLADARQPAHSQRIQRLRQLYRLQRLSHSRQQSRWWRRSRRFAVTVWPTALRNSAQRSIIHMAHFTRSA